MQNKVLKRIVLFAIILTFGAGFMTSTVHIDNNEMKQSDYTKEPESDNISLDKETGVEFINNQLVIMINTDISIDEINEQISVYGGKVAQDSMSDCGIYCIELDKPYTFMELKNLANELEMLNFVDKAEINPVISIETN